MAGRLGCFGLPVRLRLWPGMAWRLWGWRRVLGLWRRASGARLGAVGAQIMTARDVWELLGYLREKVEIYLRRPGQVSQWIRTDRS